MTLKNKTKYKILILVYLTIFLIVLKIFIHRANLTSVHINHNVQIFDLSQRLKPYSSYNSIPCRDSLKIIVKTKLCVHDLINDKYVSDCIWKEGIWEKDILGNQLFKFICKFFKSLI